MLGQVQDYAGDVKVAYIRAPKSGALVAAGWALFPFALTTVLHPEDVIRLQYIVQGQPAPRFFTSQQMGAGAVEAVIALGVLVLLQLVGTLWFYRGAQLAAHGEPVATPALWPLAALLPGLLGNAAWYWWTGYFDQSGMVIGLAPIALTVGAETFINRLGRQFVLGIA